MVCYDIFCFICGNPNRAVWNVEIEEYFDQLNLSESKRNKIYKNFELLYNSSKWLNRCTLLLQNNEVVHNLKEYSCHTDFRDASNNKYDVILNNLDNKKLPLGIFLHTDCWDFIKQQYNIELTCNDLPPYLDFQNIYEKIDYGDIENYWGQDFDFIQVAVDNKLHLCSSPLQNDKNISQIKKNINKLKLKNDPKRKGPACSATFYKEGDIKLGNNNHFWKIKKNKWLEIQDVVIVKEFNLNFNELDNKQKKFIIDTPWIGTHSKFPNFLTYIKWNDDNVELKFKTIESYKNILE